MQSFLFITSVFAVPAIDECGVSLNVAEAVFLVLYLVAGHTSGGTRARPIYVNQIGHVQVPPPRLNVCRPLIDSKSLWLHAVCVNT